MIVVDHQRFSLPEVLVPDVQIHAVLPVRVPDGLGGTREQQLSRHEDIVRDRVCRQVSQVPIPDRLEGLAVSGPVNLVSHRPVVAVSSLWHVLLGERDVRGDGSIQEVQRISLEEGPDRGWQQVERAEHRLSQRDVGGRPPCSYRLRHQEKPREDDEDQCGHWGRRYGLSCPRPAALLGTAPRRAALPARLAPERGQGCPHPLQRV